MNSHGEMLGKIKEIQDNGISMQEAKKGANVAMSIADVTFGRQVKDNDMLYVFLNDDEERVLKYKFPEMLNDDENDLLEKISEIKRSKKN